MTLKDLTGTTSPTRLMLLTIFFVFFVLIQIGLYLDYEITESTRPVFSGYKHLNGTPQAKSSSSVLTYFLVGMAILCVVVYVALFALESIRSLVFFGRLSPYQQLLHLSAVAMIGLTIFIVTTRAHMRRDRQENLALFFMTIFNAYVWVLAYLNFPIIATTQ